MIIGLPKEIKNNENRVGLTPTGVHALTGRGHRVLVEKAAGAGSNIEDEQYIYAGAEIMEDKGKIFSQSELIIKVKEPLEPEFELFKEGQILYTYLHLASNRLLTEALLNKRVSGIAYETVQLSNGQLPLLMPMSEVAGRMSVQIGANLLQKYNGGLGILLGGVPGVAPAQVVIIGGGVVGTNAAKIAVGMGAGVTILDVNRLRLVQIEDQFGGRVTTLVSNEHNLSESVKSADLLIGAVLLVGAKSPKIVTEGMVKTMKKGSVIVDVAIDQGGCIETIDHITTHDHSYYERHGVIHYSVANIPGAVPRTSTFALEAATLPYLLKIAEKGMEAALLADKALLSGLNTFKGHLTCKPVAESFNLAYKDPLTLLHA